MEVQKTHHLKQGTLLDGRYEIGAVLGEGGFGITYSGRNVNTGEKVAIKEFFSKDYMGRSGDGTGKTVLTEDTAEKRFLSERKRFLREARIIRDFRDEENLVSVSDYFEENDTAYIVMEFLDGVTLERHVQENGRWDPMDLFEHLRPLLQTLSKLHDAGLVHRDISPQNIMYTTDGRFVLIDFGSAKNLNSNTVTAASTYKEGYAPPEQYQIKNTPSSRVDIYGICATMYYCLTGETPPSSIQRVLYDDILPVSSIAPSVPLPISEMIAKGMALLPEDRQESVDDLLSVIDEVYLTPEERAQLRRSRLIRRTVAIAVILIIAGAGIFHIIDNYSYYRMKAEGSTCTHLEWDDAATAEAMSSVLSSRLDTFAGKGNYSLETNDKEIRLELPLSIFHGLDPDAVVNYYLTHAYSSFALYSTNSNGDPAGTYDLDKSLFIAKNKVTLKASDLDVQDISSDPITIAPDSTAAVRHVTIALKESDPLRDSGLLSEPGTLLYFEVDDSMGTSAYSAGDGRTIYLIDKNGLDNEKFAEMIYCTLSGRKGESLTVPDTAGGDFCGTIAANISEQQDAIVTPSSRHTELIVDWDRKASGSKSGEHQCAPEEIRGESMLVSFDTASHDLSSGDSSKSITSLKARLEALEIPYAFGTHHLKSNNIVIKVGAGSITESELMMLLTSERFKVSNGYTEYTLPSDPGFHIEDNGHYDLAVRVESYQIDSLLPVIEQSERMGLSHIYLKYGDIPVAYVDTQDARATIGENRLVFEKPCTPQIGENPERLKKHLQMVQALGQNDLSTSTVLKTVELTDKDGEYAGVGGFYSFSGDSYSGMVSLRDSINKDLESSGISARLYFGSGRRTFRISSDNIDTAGFEKNAAACINHIMSSYTFYSNDIHTDGINFVLSNKDSRAPSEPLLMTVIMMSSDLRTDTADQDTAVTSDRLITEGVPFRVISSVDSIRVDVYDADERNYTNSEESAAATKRMIQALADNGLTYYYNYDD